MLLFVTHENSMQPLKDKLCRHSQKTFLLAGICEDFSYHFYPPHRFWSVYFETEEALKDGQTW